MSDTIIVALITSAVTIFNVLYTNISNNRRENRRVKTTAFRTRFASGEPVASYRCGYCN